MTIHTETETKIIRLLLVDDHEVVRVGLRTVLSRFPSLEVVGEADSLASAIAEVERLSPDVVLLDIRLPDGSGIQACGRIRDLRPATRILVVTSYADDRLVLDAIAAGADGYLLKEANASGLVDAIHRVAAGQSYLDPAVTHSVMGHLKSGTELSTPKKLDILSAQEKRVLALVAEGKTNREIASDLNLSENTVKNYFRNTLNKLNLDRRSQAVAYFINNSAPTNRFGR